MSIHISNTGLNQMIEAMRDIQTKGIQRAQQHLDAALDATAEASRALAHVDPGSGHTGALRASQSHSSQHDRHGWTGAIVYADRGAQWELQRGGDHAAFIDGLAALSEQDFERAVGTVGEDL